MKNASLRPIVHAPSGHALIAPCSARWSDLRLIRGRCAALSAVLVAMLSSPSHAQSERESLRAIANYQLGQDVRELRAIEAHVLGATDASAGAWPDALAELLADGTASVDARRFACRLLAIVGRGTSASHLGAALRDDRLADVALLALQSIDTEESTSELRAALSEVRGGTLLGVVHALGIRRDSASFVPIARLGNGADSALRSAILESLGRIADENVVRVLAGLFQSSANLSEESFATAAVDAALLCAERRLDMGDRRNAESLFELVARQAPSDHVRMAGLRGMIRAQGVDGARTLVELMAEEGVWSPFARRLIVETPGDELTDALASELPAAAPEIVAPLVEALGERGDARAVPAIIALLSNADDAVRHAAISALASIAGDGSGATLVSHLLGGRDGSSPVAGVERDLVIAALSRLQEVNADATIAAALRNAGDSEATALVGVLAARRATGQGSSVLEVARTRSGDARPAALAALASIGSSGEIDGLAAMAAAGDADRTLAEDALVAILLREDDRDASVSRAIARYQDANENSALLMLMSRVGGPAALAHVTSALDHDHLRNEAIAALASWVNAQAFDPLLAVARSARDQAERSASVDGLIRLAGRASNQDAPRAEMYARIIETGVSEAQCLTILAGLSSASDTPSLALAEAMLADDATRADAARAIVAIAGSLGREHRLRAIAALDLVRERARDDEEILRASNAAQDRVEGDLDYVLAWMVAGPFEREGVAPGDLISTVFPPEERGAAVNWSELRPSDPAFPGRFDLAQALSGENRCAYVRTHIWTPAVQRVRLEIGSDDAVKVWLNGRVVHENNEMRALRVGEDVFEVNLREGWNTLMLKVSQGGGGWGFACRVRGADALPPRGLRIVPREDWGTTPAGAIDLFDGRDLSKWMHAGGREPAWSIDRRAMTVTAGTGSLMTREPLGDGLYYVEFSTPTNQWDTLGQARANSGVYLQGRYEVQVLDSWGDAPADNRCGGIYGKKAPDAALCARPAEWQSFLIDFTSATWNEAGEKSANARLTVWHNGVLIHQDVEVDSSTGAGASEAPGMAPLLLQDHGNPVRFGRIWHLPRALAWEGSAAAGFTGLFDGRTLSGWVRRGGEATYAVEDGAIVGRTRANQPNTFLCSEREFADFVLELEFRVDNELNSGVQIRSNSTPEYQSGRVHGYQIEIDPSERSWTAGIYDEARRGWLADLSQDPRARAALRREDWNRLRVVAIGDTIRTYLNSIPIASLRDDMTPRGFIALQVHAVGPREDSLEVRWRDIRVREIE